jgi:hypothetical protein
VSFTNNSGSKVDAADLSFFHFRAGGQAISGNNLGGGSFDVTGRPQFSAARGVANIGRGTTMPCGDYPEPTSIPAERIGTEYWLGRFPVEGINILGSSIAEQQRRIVWRKS